jgi:outer membrane PBP1 activator LpoA protein
MDWLDKITVLAIASLLIGSFAVIHNSADKAKPVRDMQQRVVSTENSASIEDLNTKAKAIRTLMEAGNLTQAEILIRELLQKYPLTQGEPHMLMGDLFMRRQEPIKAAHEFKDAIECNPDYLDKKTPLFQGKKMKIAVEEALTDISHRLKMTPGDESLKSERKTIYYLYRKIAGSCG